MVRDIVIEAEMPSGTTFRLRVDGDVIAKGVTVAQAHLLLGEILERISAANVRRMPNE
jgi:hypothetical protein